MVELGPKKVQLTGGELVIVHLTISDKEVSDYLATVAADDLADEVRRSIRVGCICLQRASTTADVDFAKRKVDELIAAMESASREIPVTLEKALLAKVGTSDGQVFSSIPTLVSTLKDAVREKVEVIRTMMSTEIDPSSNTSVLGKALQSVQSLLDPNRKDSIQSRLEQAVTSVAGPDGQLAETVKGAVGEKLAELRSKLDALSDALSEKRGADSIVQQTTLKGEHFELDLLPEIHKWAAIAGFDVEHVGGDNKPGDILVSSRQNGLMEEKACIVIEAKDEESPHGRSRVADIMLRAMETRGADAGIFVKRRADQFARELGDWGEGESARGAWVSCPVENLLTALRFIVVQKRIAAIRRAIPSVDAISIENQINRVRTTFQRLTNVQTKATKIAGLADEVKKELSTAREEIENSLAAIEIALRVSSGAPPEGEAGTSMSDQSPEENDLPF